MKSIANYVTNKKGNKPKKLSENFSSKIKIGSQYTVGNLKQFRPVSLNITFDPIVLYASGQFNKSQSFFGDYEKRNALGKA